MSELSENSDFFSEVKHILSRARAGAIQFVNSVMVGAYWIIGQRIVEEEQGGSAQAEYGVGLLKALSQSLREDFKKGFSLANLKNFRQFYLTYPDGRKGYALCSLLSWTHHRCIMRVEDERARQYYLQRCEKEGWSSRVLERQIRTHTSHRLLSTQQKPEQEIKASHSKRADTFSAQRPLHAGVPQPETRATFTGTRIGNLTKYPGISRPVGASFSIDLQQELEKVSSGRIENSHNFDHISYHSVVNAEFCTAVGAGVALLSGSVFTETDSL